MSDPICSNKRKDDPFDYDPRAQRVVDPSKWDFEAAYGKAAFRGRGPLIAVVVLGGLLLLSVWYLGLDLKQTISKALAASADEHITIIESAAQTNCILTMTMEERIQFRNGPPDAWSRWCWWIRRNGKGP